MNFYAPENFIYLWAIPAAIILFWISHKIWLRRLSKIGSLATLKTKLMPSYRASEKTKHLILLILVLLLSVCALARPQWGEEKKKVQRKGVDIIFLLDTSLSMLAEDIKPSRFEKAKIEIKSILKKLKGDRIGMVAFAGSSFLQSPLTLDNSAFLLFLDAIKVGYIPDPGTSLEKAIVMAVRSFPEKDSMHKAIILFTDGEDHEGGIDAALEAAQKANLRIYTVGMGSLQGAPIPLKDQNNRKSGFKKDRAGQVVLTKLNEELLEQIAKETGALYFVSTPGEDEADIILKHMGSLGKRDYKEKLVSEREDHYQLFLFFAILFLIAEMLVQRTRKVPGKKISVLILFILMGSASYAPQARAEDPVKLYTEKKYKSALDVYQKEKTKNPDNPAVRYNLGTTLYQVDQFQDASRELEKTSKELHDPVLKAKAYYNYGNAQYRLGNFEKAIESYKKALELNPSDQDAKYNLEFIQNKKSSFDKKDSERKNDKNKDQKDQNQQNQQQNQKDQQQNQQNQKQDQQDQQQNQQNQQQNQQDQQQNQQNQQQNQQDQQQKQQNQQQNQQDQKQDPQDQKGQEGNDKQDQQDEPQDKEKQDQKNKPDQKPQDSKQNQEPKDKESEKQDPDKKKDEQQKQKEKEEQDKKDGEKKNNQPQPSEPNPEAQQPEPKPEHEENQGEEPQPKPQEPQEEKEQPSQNQEQAPPQQPLPQGQGSGGKRPLQGQMSMESALRILDALKEGEKELQNLRQPATKEGQTHQPLKDW